jgi:ADP-ribose pyrophosphatase
MQPWRKLDERTVYARHRRVVSKRFEQPGGEMVDYEIKDEDDLVAVLALTPALEVVLVRQFRPGPEAILLELPAGVLEREEGYSNRVKHVFVAHECRLEREPEEPHLTEAVLFSLREFRDHLRGGRMADVDAGYLALDHLGLIE